MIKKKKQEPRFIKHKVYFCPETGFTYSLSEYGELTSEKDKTWEIFKDTNIESLIETGRLCLIGEKTMLQTGPDESNCLTLSKKYKVMEEPIDSVSVSFRPDRISYGHATENSLVHELFLQCHLKDLLKEEKLQEIPNLPDDSLLRKLVKKRPKFVQCHQLEVSGTNDTVILNEVDGHLILRNQDRYDHYDVFGDKTAEEMIQQGILCNQTKAFRLKNERYYMDCFHEAGMRMEDFQFELKPELGAIVFYNLREKWTYVLKEENLTDEFEKSFEVAEEVHDEVPEDMADVNDNKVVQHKQMMKAVKKTHKKAEKEV